MNKPKYLLPGCIEEKCEQPRYLRWLRGRAIAHVRRDRKRFGKDGCTVAKYKAAIHSAVAAGGDRDYYTGEFLDWSLISIFDNDAAKRGGTKYKKSLALLPTIDHTFDEHGREKFVICSWRVNDAKGDMTEAEFRELCVLVLRHRSAAQHRDLII